MSILGLDQQNQAAANINPITAENIQDYQAHLDRCLEQSQLDTATQLRLKQDWHDPWQRFLITSKSDKKAPLLATYKGVASLRQDIKKYLEGNNSLLGEGFKRWASELYQKLEVPQQFILSLHWISEEERKTRSNAETIIGEQREGFDYIANNVDAILDWFIRDEASEKIINSFLNEICQAMLANAWSDRLNSKGKHQKARIEPLLKDIRKSAKAILWDLYEIRESNKFQAWLDTLQPLDHPPEPEIEAMLEEAIADAAAGKGEYLGSFAKYADLEEE
ncbi:hypothetical protein Pse7367_3868 (plasmid) [Thalassoporum mexicanum PCC 7367]|uniref:hypothetical protein n=1 Tax=Thalassoporum mexicanum TaxID=3457544 RepID=UPI00029FA556|nr:hypothetical protein [Pseudanabaena sp. PCC 7367]AFY72091.1 hypothetical protein Pse7367_3868 [Pseudanabaena sp. PCC 7367]